MRTTVVPSESVTTYDSPDFRSGSANETGDGFSGIDDSLEARDHVDDTIAGPEHEAQCRFNLPPGTALPSRRRGGL